MRLGDINRDPKRHIAFSYKLYQMEEVKDFTGLIEKGPFVDVSDLSKDELVLLSGMFAAEAKRLQDVEDKEKAKEGVTYQ